MVGLFSLYMAWGKNLKLAFLSPDVAFDLAFIRQIYGCDGFARLTHPLPVGIASYLFDRLKRYPLPDLDNPNGLVRVERLRQFCLRNLTSFPSSLGQANSFSEDLSSRIEPSGETIARDELDEVEAILAGRLLSIAEVGRMLRLANESRKRLLPRILQALCLTGRAALLPAVVPVKGDLVRCQRCGWEGIPRLQPCRGCGNSFCCSCPDCRIMGCLTLCTPLFTAPAPPQENGKIIPFQGEGRWWRRLGRFLSGEHDAGGRDVVCTPVMWGDVGTARPTAASAVSAASGESTVFGRRMFRTDLTFTPAQEKAAETLLRFGEQGAPGSTCLVWAACGAGKTEVSFPLIGKALKLGKRVLYATPRRDVVLEIAPRLEKAFGSKSVVALYGGCGYKENGVPLVAATTHQVLRFYRSFDLVILDEGDAYPYPGSRMLHYGVERALRPEGKLVYLTATPAGWMLEQKSKKIVDIIKIPARPHGFPLPEPRFLRVTPLQIKGHDVVLHNSVLELLAAILEKDGGRIFIFVPSVELTRLVGEALRSAAGSPPLEGFRPEWIQWSHAGDRERDRRRDGFLKGEFPVLVTTTIMERGVTVPAVHVLVLEADRASVFDRATLVQMAGRCGRSPDYPTGQVWFIARSINREMEDALQEIRSFNREAFQAGYLLDDYETRLKEILSKGWKRGVAPENC